ncbi:MAG: thioredoxin domain-containing protein [Gammaproteobacteria bacterium]|nr:thioredoxin domain-containing protein [Gammaproteobacteria bacterium]
MKHLITFFLINLSFHVYAGNLKNTLQQHASPYLAMHGTDPVAWQQWNKETIARAKKEGKLIYVSSGYFSCHWCHVMQRESYKNKIVANILNSNFIPVKIDREINSALDSHLIDFVERTQGRAGWPLNVFITPDGYPLVGMTYLPASNFIEVLKNIESKWKQEKHLLESMAKDATKELSIRTKNTLNKLPTGLGQKYITRFLKQATTMADDMAGGFGQQNKFPSFPQLTVMLKSYENSPDKDLKQFLLLTLNKMASQGLNDQLGGGFFRYAVDPNWQIPHFEKMLYDNALLASLYLDAARVFKSEKYSKIAQNTLDFLLNVFRSKSGAYIASLSAIDNKGVEGGYYLWQRDELKKLLNQDELKVVELMWQLEGPADLEGGYHLVEIMNATDAAKILKISSVKAKNDFNSAKKKMLLERNKRNVPRDDKLLAAWNGLALTAFSKAAKQFKSEPYAKAAKEIKDYIHKNLWIKKKLVRAIKGKHVLGEAGLEDYAYVAQGLSHWLDYSFNKKDKKWLEEIMEQAWNRFHNKQGWLLAENSLLKYGEGEEVISDGVLPSASSILLNVSLKEAVKYKNIFLKKKILNALKVGHNDLEEQPFWYASQISILYEFQSYYPAN